MTAVAKVGVPWDCSEVHSVLHLERLVTADGCAAARIALALQKKEVVVRPVFAGAEDLLAGHAPARHVDLSPVDEDVRAHV